MNHFLDQILEKKREEVALLKKSPMKTKEFSQVPSFLKALSSDKMGVIAEVKRRSPSAGSLNAIADVVPLASRYIEGGAVAISVLTDAWGFGGSVEDLLQLKRAFPNSPILRKDFIVDPIQVAQTALLGASAVLLIVAVLQEQTDFFVRECQKHHIEPLVEVHSCDELKIALNTPAKIIGVNNRNLKTFDVQLDTCQKLSPLIPDGVIKVAESGIKTKQDVQKMQGCGYGAVLVGETLVCAQDPEAVIKEFAEVSA